MAVYIRKVIKSKWDWRVPLDPNLPPGELGTDGITNCCRTHQNTLSIWKIDSDELSSDDDKKVIATLATNCASPSFVDYVIISDEELAECDVQVRQVDGDSIIPDIVSKHYDIFDLKANSLASLAKLINKKVSGVRNAAGQVVGAELQRIDLQTVRQCIVSSIPLGSDIYHQLMLKTEFAKVYS